MQVDSMRSVPDQLNSNWYIVGTPTPKWLILECPCGCGDRIDVNLMRSQYPYWVLSIENGLISLNPSLWRSKNTCGSHFWIREGQIAWARAWDDGQIL